jgi:hypothetical protein
LSSVFSVFSAKLFNFKLTVSEFSLSVFLATVFSVFSVFSIVFVIIGFTVIFCFFVPSLNEVGFCSTVFLVSIFSVVSVFSVKSGLNLVAATEFKNPVSILVLREFDLVCLLVSVIADSVSLLDIVESSLSFAGTEILILVEVELVLLFVFVLSASLAEADTVAAATRV